MGHEMKEELEEKAKACPQEGVHEPRQNGAVQGESHRVEDSINEGTSAPRAHVPRGLEESIHAATETSSSRSLLQDIPSRGQVPKAQGSSQQSHITDANLQGVIAWNEYASSMGALDRSVSRENFSMANVRARLEQLGLRLLTPAKPTSAKNNTEFNGVGPAMNKNKTSHMVEEDKKPADTGSKRELKLDDNSWTHREALKHLRQASRSAELPRGPLHERKSFSIELPDLEEAEEDEHGKVTCVKDATTTDGDAAAAVGENCNPLDME